ncbi:NAD(P)-dependent dehydrogenase (short-subunit alcohol dehydrogenase family) [Actinoplanes lutulentus]|uniref:NAD(P)-dependent dehydrogenase (Short-subunit alcohol dehydrogenase family) n=1 Tax=Actinoplanes lutulentus TaxID=1287878 RepID=A0A327Z9R1_9ACTN|nr:short-chain dehydrogenase [Actinoplanes lutulentus]MBB2943175.1 NAD(P)-dependent dehydrogenase (short-subunit alcohol dehydrogenase family) [Actinoplanes lutulentus]RAK28241.1 NAD(P)-dependent dehydrogenase (short-subunit alcohol dehydrogenase family) [Actinoplanes lutulentus]
MRTAAIRTVVITGGTRGIGGALASRLTARGDRVVALGSADADLSSVRETEDLVSKLPDRIDLLVLAAGSFSTRRRETAEGLEHTFAVSVLSRFLLVERLLPALARGTDPVVVSLCGVGGIPAGRIRWDDLQLTRDFSLFTSTMQGARILDLLGTGFADRHPESPVRYVLYNPLFVNSGMHRQLDQPLRTIVGAAASVLGQSPDASADRLERAIDELTAAKLTALRRGKPVSVTTGPADAERLYAALDGLVSRRTSG